MRGGVSLAVWIGGAVQEIDRLRVGLHGESDNSLVTLARVAGYSAVTVDVLAGASAGGLNAAIYASAMTQGHPVDRLRGVWMKDADFERLLLEPGTDTLSILNGGYFHDRLREEFDDLHGEDGQLPAATNVEVLLSVTSIVPYAMATHVDPTVSEQRIDGQIRFRYRRSVSCRATYGLAHDLPALGASPSDAALAARSTAAFPVAFEPQRIAEDQLKGRLEFDPGRPHPTWLYDGGVVDNMPVGKALRAIDDAPADGLTQRYLVYLHPSPGLPDSKAADKAARTLDRLGHEARPFDVLSSAAKALRGKSLVADLAALDQHNRRVDRDLAARSSLLRQSGPVAVPAGEIARLDAERLVSLLRHPRAHLQHVTEPVDPRPVITDADGFDRDQLEGAIAQRILGDGRPLGSLPSMVEYSWRPWSATIRILSLLIEWCLALERDDLIPSLDEVGATKERLYHLRAYAYWQAGELNRETIEDLTASPVPADVDTLADRVQAIRIELIAHHAPEVEKVWGLILAEAALLRALSPSPVATDGPPADGGAAADAASGPRLDPLARTLVELIPPEGTAGQVAAALDRLDCLLFPQHLHAPTGSLSKVEYQTISGTANTPLAHTYVWPANAPPGLNDCAAGLFQSLRRAPLAPGGVAGAGEGLCDPESKLAGNQLHNFAAFVEEHWRANDWMWGQADAAATLVDLLLGRTSGTDPDAASDAGPRPPRPTVDVVEGICVRTVGDEEFDELAERPWKVPGVKLAVEAELTSPTGGLELTRALLLWRRHLEIFHTEFARPAVESNPSGRGPGATFTETLAEWDRSPRRLSTAWGSRRPAALGNRAGFLAWRTLFAGTGFELQALRHATAPVVAPLIAFFLGRRMTVFALLAFLTGAVLPRVYDDALGQVLVVAFALAVGIGGLWFTRRPLAALGRFGPDVDTEQKTLQITEFWALLSAVTTVVCVLGAVVISPTTLEDFHPDGPYYLPMVATVTAVAAGLTWFWVKWYWWIPITGIATALASGWAWLGENAGEVRDWHPVGGLLNALGSFWFAVIAIAVVTTAIGTVFDVGARRDPKR